MLIGILASGCSTEDPGQIEFGTSGGVFDPDESSTGTDDGADETGSNGQLGPGQCVLDPVEGVIGERWHCGGTFSVTLTAEGQEPFLFELPFGPTALGASTDSPLEPFVMACCGDYGSPDALCDGLHLWACFNDVVQQACSGIPTRLRQMIESGEVPDTPGSNALQKHLAENTQVCFDTIADQVGLRDEVTSCPESGAWEDRMVGATFAIEEDFGLISNPTVRIESAIVDNFIATGIECSSWNDNDMFLPVSADPVPEMASELVLENGELTVEGENMDGSLVHEVADLASWSTGCGGLECSRISLQGSWLDDTLVLHRLELRSAAGAVHGGGSGLEIERFKISLIHTAMPSSYEGGLFEFEAGSLVFLLAANDSLSGAFTIVATNSSPMVLEAGQGNLEILPFTVVHSDDRGALWTVHLEATTWVPAEAS